VVVPTSFINFFAASAGASAALIGLLFVAISIMPERIISQQAAPERRVTAVNIFAGLLNGFFISLAALIPQTNLAYVVIILAPLSAYSSLRLIVGYFQSLWRAHEHIGIPVMIRRLVLTVASIFIYACEIWWAIEVFSGGFSGHSAYVFLAYLLLGVYTSGLTRAWGLVVDRQSNLIPWLNPLYGVGEQSANQTDQQGQRNDAQPVEVRPVQESPS